MSAFKLITKDTDLSKLELHYVPWDVVIHNDEYKVYRIDGYVHTIGGKWGDNCYWCCPRHENPSVNNLIPFDSDCTCSWGFKVENVNNFNSHMGDVCVENRVRLEITRNGSVFHHERFNDFSYAVVYAQKYIA